ncbi:hypothetical protein Tco_0421850 [Tanacetum coccineum]
MTISFLSRLNGYYREEKKGSYRPQFLEAYSEASHINNSIPKKEKVPRIFSLPCFINNVCFDNSLADLVSNGKFVFPVDFIILDMPEDIKFLDDMDAYRDEGMGDVIFGEPF